MDYVPETGNVDLVTGNPQRVQIFSKGSFSSNGKSPTFPTGILQNSDEIENDFDFSSFAAARNVLSKIISPCFMIFFGWHEQKEAKALHMGMNKCSILLLQVSQK